MKPTRKVTVATLAAAITTVLFVVLRDVADFTASAELQGATTTILVAVLAWLTTDSERR